MANDLYSRSGVMTFMFRVMVCEQISGQEFEDAPTKSADEFEWFKGLMGNEKFRNIYDNINWEDANWMSLRNEHSYPRPENTSTIVPGSNQPF